MSDERSVAGGERSQVFSRAARHIPLVFFITATMEVVLLALICLAPWNFGAIHPGSEFLLDVGIAVLLALWAVRMLLEGQIAWKKSTVAICLAGLFLLGIWQATPLPRPVLAWLSPGTVGLYDQLFPQKPEIALNPLTGETLAPASSDAAVPPGSTISLYPHATQRETTRLLAVFLVFAVVFNNLTSKEALIRLSWVALINGALLSFFALFQFFAAPRSTVYWIFPTQVTPFGPFVCRNHFACYVNMCIGLGIGLLLSQGSRGPSAASREQDVWPLQVLRNPSVLGICGALGLMVTAVAFSCSRGGLLALVGAAVLCGVLGRQRLGLSYRVGSILAVAGVVAAFFAWFGIDLIKDRLATLGTGEAFEDRMPLWLRSLPIVPKFPIWGTGYGTFGYIEPMYRLDAPSWEGQWPASYEHAHNDYLEIVVEGGVVGMCLAVLALAAVYRLGLRALAVHRGSSRAGLTLGALFAFTALALHSFGDFGAHIPALTLLAVVVCAHLCALGQSKPHYARSENKGGDVLLASASGAASSGNDLDGDTYRLRIGGIAPLLGALVAIGLGLVICADSLRIYRIDRLEQAVLRTGAEADQLRTRIAYLTEAVSLVPEDARLHYALGCNHERLAELLAGGDMTELIGRLNLAGARRKMNTPEGRAALELGELALRDHLRARDACPLLAEAHIGIASRALKPPLAIWPYMKEGDDPEDYFRRAKLLNPGRADIWYDCGRQEILTWHPEEGLATLRHCLELSDRYLPDILAVTSPRLGTNRLLKELLPDNPQVLLAAAMQLYPEFGSVERRRPFLEKALYLLGPKEQGPRPQPQDILVKARIYRALEQPDEAIPLYREFFARDSSQVRLRYEFASYLRDVRKLEEARRELTVLLAQDPKNRAAKELRDAVLSEMLQEKSQERKRQREDWWIRHQQQQR